MYQHSTTTGGTSGSIRAMPYDHLMDNAGPALTLGDGIALGGAAALMAGAVLIARHSPRRRTGLGDRGGLHRAKAARSGQRSTKRTWPVVAP